MSKLKYINPKILKNEGGEILVHPSVIDLIKHFKSDSNTTKRIINSIIKAHRLRMRLK